MTARLPRIDEHAVLTAAVRHHQAGELHQAKELYRAILTQNPRHAEAIFRLGTMALQLEQYEKAADFICQAIKIGKPTVPMYINHGAALRHLEKYDEAIQSYDRAIRMDKSRADAFFNKGRALQATSQWDKAKQAYETAIKLDPKDAQAWVNLGTIERELENFDAALQCFERAARLDPGLAAAYANAGSILFDRGLFKVAMVLIKHALELDPDNIEFRYRLSTYLLMFGHLEDGWRDFDTRFETVDSIRATRRPAPPKTWEGKTLEEFSGLRVRLWTEQGLGEEILAAGTFGNLKDIEADFVCESSPRMVPIFQRAFPWMTFVPWDLKQTYLDTEAQLYDVQYPAHSLLKWRGGTLDAIASNTPYLQPRPDLLEEYQTKLRDMAGGRPIVGIGWESLHIKFGTEKSLPLGELGTALRTDDAFFVCLQHGDVREEIDRVHKEVGIDIYWDDSTENMKDLERALAVIKSVDLMISSSNTAVHMAGAMDVPTWLLLPAAYGLIWHWFLDTEVSPWYPSVRMFRQQSKPERGNPWWPDTIERTGDAFAAWLKDTRRPQTEAAP